MMRMFNQVLAEYETHQIQNAFTQWTKTSSIMPTPADIVKIIEDKTFYNRPEYKVLPKDEVHPLYCDLSEKDQAQVDAWIAQARKILRADEPKTKNDKPLRNHYASMPVAAQKKVKSNWIESVKKLRAKIYGEEHTA